jgi:hypothetical protein
MFAYWQANVCIISENQAKLPLLISTLLPGRLLGFFLISMNKRAWCAINFWMSKLMWH